MEIESLKKTCVPRGFRTIRDYPADVCCWTVVQKLLIN